MIANWDLFSAYYSMLVHRFSHSCSLMQQIVSYFGCATRHVGPGKSLSISFKHISFGGGAISLACVFSLNFGQCGR